MSKSMIFNIVNILILLFFLQYLFNIYANASKLLKNLIKDFETMDVYFKRRYIIVKNLSQIAKGLLIKDISLAERIEQLSSRDYKTLSRHERLILNMKINLGLEKLFQIALDGSKFRYNAEFSVLQRKIRDIEDNIEKTKKEYNSSVKIYNNYVEKKPRCIFLQIFKLGPENAFGNFSIEQIERD